jgi:hypothetical protein
MGGTALAHPDAPSLVEQAARVAHHVVVDVDHADPQLEDARVVHLVEVGDSEAARREPVEGPADRVAEHVEVQFGQPVEVPPGQPDVVDVPVGVEVAEPGAHVDPEKGYASRGRTTSRSGSPAAGPSMRWRPSCSRRSSGSGSGPSSPR